MIFIWSDTHFHHENILGYTDRHKVWGSVPEMNAGLIENARSVVTPGDVLLTGGDAVMGQRIKTLPIVEELPGIRQLVMGNHDSCHPSNKKAAMWQQEYAKYFAWMGLDKYLKIDGLMLRLNHFPRTGDSHDTDRYPNWRPEQGIEDVLLHGHVHSEDVITGPDQIHIGVDADWTPYGVERYHPIPLTTILEVIKEKL